MSATHNSATDSMTYDVVVIGHTMAGHYAALQAARQKARVALVTQNCQPTVLPHQGFAHIAAIVQQMNYADRLQIFTQTLAQSDLDWQAIRQWLEMTAIDLQHTHYALADLAALGVDVIPEAGEFRRKPQLGFGVGKRLLRSRAYLLAIDYRPAMPDLLGLQQVGYITCQTPLKQRPQSLVILGDGPIAIELAQLYASLGTMVTIVLRHPQILPGADAEIAFLLQAHLETQGIEILRTTEAPQVSLVSAPQVDQVKISLQKQVTIGDRTLLTDEILVAAGWEPNLEGLNLAAIHGDQPIQVNAKLQINPLANPRRRRFLPTAAQFYWCSHPVASIAHHHVEIALDNTLFWPRRQPQLSSVAQSVQTDPELAWVGLTEAQAIQKYDRQQVIALRLPFNHLVKNQLTGATTGLGKVIIHRSGRILGAHLLSRSASEMIGVFSLAIQKHLSIQDLSHLSVPYPSLLEAIQQSSLEWHQWQRDRPSPTRFLKERYFAWQRSWL